MLTYDRPIVLFEDHRLMPISRLLYYTYNYNVMFCETCDNLAKKVRHCVFHSMNSIDIICFCDCPPDNPEALKVYRELCIEFKDNERVTILKSQCIEHYVLKCLINLRLMPNTKDISDFININNGIKVEYNDETYEKFCKRVLNGNGMRCFANKLSRKYSWYVGDCCSQNDYSLKKRGIPQKCKPLSKKQKALALMYHMPYRDENFIPDRFSEFFKNIGTDFAISFCKREFDIINNSIHHKEKLL